MLQSMGSQTVGHYWMTELNWTECTGDNATLPVPFFFLKITLGIWGFLFPSVSVLVQSLSHVLLFVTP